MLKIFYHQQVLEEDVGSQGDLIFENWKLLLWKPGPQETLYWKIGHWRKNLFILIENRFDNDSESQIYEETCTFQPGGPSVVFYTSKVVQELENEPGITPLLEHAVESLIQKCEELWNINENLLLFQT